jgi:hypothetical protein
MRWAVAQIQEADKIISLRFHLSQRAQLTVSKLFASALGSSFLGAINPLELNPLLEPVSPLLLGVVLLASSTTEILEYSGPSVPAVGAPSGGVGTAA